MAISIQQVAKRAGVSPATVSKILNKTDLRFKEHTLQQVRQAAEELGYRPNAMAQGLAMRRTKTIGVLFTWAGSQTVGSLYSMGVLSGMLAGAAHNEYQLLVYTKAWRNAAESAGFFSSSHTDGVVIVAPNMDSDVVSGFIALETPIVLLSCTNDPLGVDYVKVNNTLGVTLALDHLWELGHRRIAYAGPATSQQSDWQERYDAYATWMKSHDLPIQQDDIAEFTPVTDVAFVPRLQEYLTQPNAPTAMFCPSDFIALAVIGAATTLGVALPEQLSIVGFDDDLLASVARPQLTTVRQPFYEIGFQAAQVLIQNLEIGKKGGDKLGSHIIAPQLIVRESTGPVMK